MREIGFCHQIRKERGITLKRPPLIECAENVFTVLKTCGQIGLPGYDGGKRVSLLVLPLECHDLGNILWGKFPDFEARHPSSFEHFTIPYLEIPAQVFYYRILSRTPFGAPLQIALFE